MVIPRTLADRAVVPVGLRTSRSIGPDGLGTRFPDQEILASRLTRIQAVKV